MLPKSYKIPNEKGPPVRITVFKDTDHEQETVTRRLFTGILLLINNTPVKWISKRQKTVETSTYGSELVAAKTAVELILEYCYILKMMRAQLEKSALMLGDNKSVVLNTTMPSSVLKKKHSAVSFHRVREMIAAGVVKFSHIPLVMNYSDLLTKPLSHTVFHRLVKPLLFRQPPSLN